MISLKSKRKSFLPVVLLVIVLLLFASYLQPRPTGKFYTYPGASSTGVQPGQSSYGYLPDYYRHLDSGSTGIQPGQGSLGPNYFECRTNLDSQEVSKLCEGEGELIPGQCDTKYRGTNDCESRLRCVNGAVFGIASTCVVTVTN